MLLKNHFNTYISVYIFFAYHFQNGFGVSLTLTLLLNVELSRQS